MIDVSMIRTLEACAFNAWPALETVGFEGWVLRFSAGYSKRANSVNALAPTASFQTILDEARAAYRRRDLPLLFRLTALAGDEAFARLADLGGPAPGRSHRMSGGG